jgi:rhamnose utilization protein RhaD (predicted bifunctional aldolase and dehydrogenase)/NAD(P)-dependent dehydrogenase (short-subunit alcohol dehydrogenase family)
MERCSMNSLWNNQEAAQATNDLAQCVYLARLLGQEQSLVWPGSVSVKITAKDLFGEERENLYVSARDANLATIAVDDLAPVRLDDLVRLAKLDTLSDLQLVNELAVRLTTSAAPAPSVDALLHAVLPFKFVSHVRTDALLAVTNTLDAIERIREIYGGRLVVVPYARSGFALAKLLADAFEGEVSTDPIGVLCIRQGIISFGETARIAYERTIELVSRAEEYLLEQNAWHLTFSHTTLSDEPRRHELAALRKEISAVAGFPVIVSTHSDALCLSFARRDDVSAITQRGPAVPEHAIITKPLPLLGRDVAAFGKAYQQYVDSHAVDTLLTRRDLAPRVLLDPELGMCTVGRSAREAAVVSDIYRHTMEIILRAEALDSYEPASVQDAFDVEYSELAHTGQDVYPIFAGEVALVTGAASGIGKACVESFLARGAAVVGLDINPKIGALFDRPDYLGLQCDVTDEDAVRAALEATARAFGGLDMLVLNAGLFPAGCRIESLQLDEWDRVLRVNLDANITMMREAHPLLKLAPGGGRAVINGSRNVLAPGPGAAAYSTSKAGLTQLGRVAAMEWGQDGIRVNTFHAHAVFDTGIWTEEVLRARAEHYGLTVEQYKKNNVLGVEVTSHDVGELAAEMCGPLFAKSTGAQVPIDGGSNRVI